MTVILGGGISGLCAAFYSCERRLGQPILLEASERLGGWIHSVETSTGTMFEMGPRMIRPKGPQGKNTLSLIDRLDLSEKLIPISRNHPSARNRMIYVNGKLHLLPNSPSSMLRNLEPFDGPLIKIIWKDLTSRRTLRNDESVYSFAERRFGRDVAENLISPMLCGICAGDAKNISVNAIMPSLFEAEQKHGSVFRGLLVERMKRMFFKDKDKVDAEAVSASTKSAENGAWAMWGLRGGFEQLPKKLTERLQSNGVEIRLNEKCEKITFLDDEIRLETNEGSRACSRLISSLSAKALAPLLEHQHPQLAGELSEIPTVTVAVVNLEFPGKCLSNEGFGFLVPPKEKNPILGVIFDSCVFPNENSTVLTVMMGGAWFREYFGPAPSEEYLLKVALEQVTKILGIKVAPTSRHVAVLKDCIAQHVVGHKQRVERIQKYISTRRLPLALCGSSYQGIGVNDVILSAKQAVCDIVEREKTR